MVERPLFTPSRRLVRPLEPSPEPEPMGEEEPVVEAVASIERPDLRFFGTVRQRGRVTALVTREDRASMEQLAVGATVDDWKVAEVTRDRLVLTHDDRREVYAIFSSGGAEATDADEGAESDDEATGDGADEADDVQE
jgi:hypothetical protein